MARHETPDLRDRLEYAAFAILLGVLRLPSRSGGRRLGRGLGRLVSRAVPIRREIALENLRKAFPEWSDKRGREVYRGMCENLGLTLAEFARFGKRPRENLASWIRVENAGAVDRALAAGKGVLLVTAHFGNWEVLAAALAVQGHRMTAVGARQRNPLVEALFTRYRQNAGLSNITVDKNLRPLLQALNEGACIATLADQDGGPGGFFLDFLGRPASVQAGLFRLLARRGTPMVTGFAVREREGWRGEFHDPVFPRSAEKGAPQEAEARRLAALYTARVEEYVRRHPDHWFWVHRRWHTRPPGN
jgi:KDO2-lipid IV(A) lauroyltransferase